MRLAYPKNNIRIESINYRNVLNGMDTLKALALTTISGKVYFNGQVKSDFTGKAFITVFDKTQEQNTL